MGTVCVCVCVVPCCVVYSTIWVVDEASDDRAQLRRFRVHITKGEASWSGRCRAVWWFVHEDMICFCDKDVLLCDLCVV